MTTNEAVLPTEEELKDVLSRILLETNVPGIGLALSVGGKRMAVYAGIAALGYKHALSEQSRFEMSCLMKLFCSLVAFELSAQRELSLDIGVDEWLPELRRNRSSASIKIRHLLNHTSGYRGVDIGDARVRWNYSWERLVEHFNQSEQSFPPGRVFNYEHSEHVILGRIINRVCRRPCSEVLRELIFDRLGIRPSRAVIDQEGQSEAFVGQHTYSPSHAGFVPASIPAFGSMWATSLPDATITLNEALTVGESLLRASSQDRGGQSFTNFTLDSVLTAGAPLPPQVASGVRSEEIPLSFGTGCAHYRDGMLGHNGSVLGQTCALRFDPVRNIVIAVGVNAWLPYARDRAAKRVLALALGARSEETSATDDAQFRFEQMAKGFAPSDLVGKYLGSYLGEVNVVQESEAFHLQLGPLSSHKPRISVVPVGNGGYSIRSPSPIMVGFFPDPVTRGSALMIGVHAYKKQ
jgi:CubicO group peptidase (beta-lactamase class C family)